MSEIIKLMHCDCGHISFFELPPEEQKLAAEVFYATMITVFAWIYIAVITLIIASNLITVIYRLIRRQRLSKQEFYNFTFDLTMYLMLGMMIYSVISKGISFPVWILLLVHSLNFLNSFVSRILYFRYNKNKDDIKFFIIVTVIKLMSLIALCLMAVI